MTEGSAIGLSILTALNAFPRCGQRAIRTAACNIASRPAVVFRPLSFHAPAAVVDALRNDERSFNVMPRFGGDRCLSTSKVCRASTACLSAKLRETGRARHTRALGQRRRPFRRGPWLWNALPRTISRRGSPMPGLDAGAAGRRRLAGSGTLLLTALVEAQMLPLPDGSIDRLLVAHALEAADRRMCPPRNCGASPRQRDESSSSFPHGGASGLGSTARHMGRACLIREGSCVICFIARFSRRSSGVRRFMRRRSAGPS